MIFVKKGKEINQLLKVYKNVNPINLTSHNKLFLLDET